MTPPYSELPVLLRKRNTTPESIIEKIGIQAYRASLAALESVEDIDANWAELLVQTARKYELGQALHKYGDRLVRGEEIDTNVIQKIVSDMGRSNYGKLVQSSKIVPSEELFTEIGWAPLDEHVGGLPTEGICTISADTGAGKTWALLRIAQAFGEQKRKFAIFSLELPSNVLTYRMALMELPKRVRDYIYICDTPMSFDQIAVSASQEDDLEGMGIDFADLIVRDSSEQLMANLYIDAHIFTREHSIPCVMLAQFRRTYNQPLPTIQDMRWSGMVEKLSKLVLLGHNPSQSYIGRPESQTLPTVEGKAYLIVGKSTHGFVHGSVGAIQIDWQSSKGWGDQSSWFPLTSI